MQIEGTWYICDDDVVRPVIRGKVLAANSSWSPVEFLVDTGADRTVFSAAALEALHLPHAAESTALEGIGGRAESVTVATAIALRDERGGDVLFRGTFAAFTHDSALDMSVLGRDILNLFALIVDRPQSVVCLLSQRHSYTISAE
jgi:hypothetical protein